jgi:hypothetical protein
MAQEILLNYNLPRMSYSCRKKFRGYSAVHRKLFRVGAVPTRHRPWLSRLEHASETQPETNARLERQISKPWGPSFGRMGLMATRRNASADLTRRCER